MVFSHTNFWRRISALSLAGGLLLVTLPSPSYAQAKGLSIGFRPHCEEEDEQNDACEEYEAATPDLLQTPELGVDDTLDLDLVIQNPTGESVNHVRSWLSYDPNVLEGIEITIHENFPDVTPGESDFDELDGYAMIEASNEEDDSNTESTVVVARVQMRIKKTPVNGTVIGFFNVQPGGHTTVSSIQGEEDIQILQEEPGSLHVRLIQVIEEETDPTPLPPDIREEPTPEEGMEESTNGTVRNGDQCTENADCQSSLCASGVCIPSILQPVEETATPTEEPPAETDVEDMAEGTPEERTAFALLQVRNVRVTTEGSALYIAWDGLQSSSLKANNIYYGTTSGRYIQRKTVDGVLNSLVIRALPVGTTYYLSVRAVNMEDEESAFSQEVSIEVGNPRSSTSPLSSANLPGPSGANPLEGNLAGTPLPGETGASSVIAFILLFAAAIGSTLAFRRQFTVLENPSA